MLKFVKQISLLVLVLIISACGNLTKNMVKDGDFKVVNGRFGNREWKENLVFKRYSWYHELSLTYEIKLAKLSQDSSFRYWFSKEELDEVNKCQDFRIVLAYSLDNKKIPHHMMLAELEKSGYHKVEILNFKNNLMLHPDSEMNSLSFYQVYGICGNLSQEQGIIVSFSGFPQVTIP